MPRKMVTYLSALIALSVRNSRFQSATGQRRPPARVRQPLLRDLPAVEVENRGSTPHGGLSKRYPQDRQAHSVTISMLHHADWKVTRERGSRGARLRTNNRGRARQADGKRPPTTDFAVRTAPSGVESVSLHVMTREDLPSTTSRVGLRKTANGLPTRTMTEWAGHASSGGVTLARRLRTCLFLLLTACIILSASPCSADTADDVPYLLSMPDLSSPRATLLTLMTNGRHAMRLFEELGPGWLPRAPLRRMTDTLDARQIPPAQRPLTAALTVIRLSVVLDRIVPRLMEAPDAAAVARDGIKQWRIPGTPIVIARTEDGPWAGQFQFVAETVGLSAELYAASEKLAGPGQVDGHEISEVAYSPGPLLSRHMIAILPPGLRTPLFGQAAWQWLGLAVTLLLSGAVAVRCILWGMRRDARVSEATRRYGQPAAAAIATTVFGASLLFIVFGLKIWGDALAVILTVLQLVLTLTVGWFAMVSIHRLADIVIGARGLRGTSIDGHLIKVVATLLSIGLGLYLFFTAADLVGIPVAPLLAGLGIGGLAIALAVRPTLENVIGGLTLFADGPARVGDVCRFGTEMGTIEEIGLRTTKVRKLDDALLSVPNAELAQVRIENMTRRRKFLYNPRLGLRYETTAEQLRQVSDAIMALLTRHQKVLDDGFRVRLAGFGDYAINLDVFAYVDVTRMPDFLVVQEELNLAVMAIVKQAGTGFAFPSQTNYIAKDSFP